ncbi:MAG: DUF4252 domain-containing protein [Saprospiraceae bacterium]|nr:DUF4252 domain-containing protein [Saprospiraceae bacterium]
MKPIATILIFFLFISSSFSQSLSPDKFINKIKKEDSAFAFTVPGWLIRAASGFATRDLEDKERRIVQELTSHIKKLRFVVAETLPDNFDETFSSLKSYMSKNNYESLIQVRDEGNNVNLWAKFDDDIIKRLVISVIGEEESVVLNIKSNLNMAVLERMEFFKEWKDMP